MSNELTRTCLCCKGEGVTVRAAFTYTNESTGKVYSYPEDRKTCTECLGVKYLPGIDVKALFEAVTTSRGAAKGKRIFRKSAPTHWGSGATLGDRRAYYVWRLARFHGGKDVTMPMTADMLSRNDPFKKELDLLSDLFAQRIFGSHMAGAHRWGGLLGFRKGDAPAGLPAAAYESGPVADENKPEWEALELR